VRIWSGHAQPGQSEPPGWFIKRANGHYIRNTGTTDLVYLEVFRSSFR
jgi:oxalate decarboxylase/phosphoglucose isomerase-like protein (cupin superfamily)